ncbi:hypothetical protein L2E82_30101 [Cichorium intybus]|uniref:Uncharacterized protein n=2 Tax=Cichorium intybus TaxID=13427 RepID=A0ACB9AD97_CICIN|nr:hypothetical protein L2E82_36956 [Cichorium intybus]KAI3739690.1 hypothetical protein L2E82_30101 [Cichorium intybus]
MIKVLYMLYFVRKKKAIRSVAVRQEVPQKSKDSLGCPWQFVGLFSLFDPPRHDSAETIRRALILGYEIGKKLQERKHIFGLTEDGVNDAPALKKAGIGIAVADAARGASEIVLNEPGLGVILLRFNDCHLLLDHERHRLLLAK